MSIALLEDGAIITVIGMGMVFAFLTILVFAMQLMAIVMRYLNKKFPAAVPEIAAPRRQGNDDSAVALAIAAVMAYQNK